MQYFIEAINAGSFNKDALKLNTTHQSVSSAITNLENELDTILIVRGKQGICLTEAGSKAKIHFENILNELYILKNSLKEEQNKSITGELNVFVSPLILHLIAPNALTAFISKYPKVHLTFKEMDGYDIYESLSNYTNSLSIGSFSPWIQNVSEKNNLCIQTLPNFLHFFALVHKNHPLSKIKTISLKTLFKYPLAEYYSLAMNKYFAPYGNPSFAFSTTNINVYKQAILSGQYIGFVPKLDDIEFDFYSSKENDIVYIPIREFSPIPLYYAYINNVNDKELHLFDLFIDVFKSVL